jgi:hypothetical protein
MGVVIILKSKLVRVITLSFLITCIVVSGIAVYKNSRHGIYAMKKVALASDHILYYNAEDLIKYSDLVIIGTPTKDLEQESPYTKYYNDYVITDFYTLRNIKINKVLKGEYSDKTINALENAAIITNANHQQELLVQEDYSVMQKGKKYLLFLKINPKGDYSTVAINQGKFNIDNSDMEEKESSEKNKQLNELKKLVLDRFKEEVK